MATVNECLIGNPIIKSYVVTLNFSQNEMYLSPIAGTHFKEGLATFGFAMVYADGKVIVKTLYKGLAAEKAGLVLNDAVIAIDGQVVAYPDECIAMDLLARLLNEKSEINLTVLRSGVKKDIRVVKEKVF